MVAPRTAELISELRAKQPGGKLHRGASLACIKQAMDEVYKAADHSVKTEVREKIVEQIKTIDESKSAEQVRTPATYAR